MEDSVDQFRMIFDTVATWRINSQGNLDATGEYGLGAAWKYDESSPLEVRWVPVEQHQRNAQLRGGPQFLQRNLHSLSDIVIPAFPPWYNLDVIRTYITGMLERIGRTGGQNNREKVAKTITAFPRFRRLIVERIKSTKIHLLWKAIFTCFKSEIATSELSYYSLVPTLRAFRAHDVRGKQLLLEDLLFDETSFGNLLNAAKFIEALETLEKTTPRSGTVGSVETRASRAGMMEGSVVRRVNSNSSDPGRKIEQLPEVLVQLKEFAKQHILHAIHVVKVSREILGQFENKLHVPEWEVSTYYNLGSGGYYFNNVVNVLQDYNIGALNLIPPENELAELQNYEPLRVVLQDIEDGITLNSVAGFQYNLQESAEQGMDEEIVGKVREHAMGKLGKLLSERNYGEIIREAEGNVERRIASYYSSNQEPFTDEEFTKGAMESIIVNFCVEHLELSLTGFDGTPGLFQRYGVAKYRAAKSVIQGLNFDQLSLLVSNDDSNTARARIISMIDGAAMEAVSKVREEHLNFILKLITLNYINRRPGLEKLGLILRGNSGNEASATEYRNLVLQEVYSMYNLEMGINGDTLGSIVSDISDGVFLVRNDFTSLETLLKKIEVNLAR